MATATFGHFTSVTLPLIWAELTDSFDLFLYDRLISEAVAWRCSAKKVFLEILQNSQENTCSRVSFLIKLQASACTYI